jgi:hypothetical protein
VRLSVRYCWHYSLWRHLQRSYGFTGSILNLLAQALFWPAALATKLVRRRLRLRAFPQIVAVMGGFSLVLMFLFAVPFAIVGTNYAWRFVARDTFGAAAAAVASFILYGSIVGRASLVVSRDT